MCNTSADSPSARSTGTRCPVTASIGQTMLFSTACEPSPVNEQRVVEVWAARGGGGWRPLLRLEKDRWPMKLFQYGQVRFPAGKGADGEVWLCPMATNLDQVSVRLPLDCQDWR